MYVAKKEEDLGTGASTTTSSLMVAILERALDVLRMAPFTPRGTLEAGWFQQEHKLLLPTYVVKPSTRGSLDSNFILYTRKNSKHHCTTSASNAKIVDSSSSKWDCWIDLQFIN